MANTKDQMRNVFKELLLQTECIKNVLENNDYACGDVVVHITKRPDISMNSPFWSISDVKDNCTVHYGSGFIKERQYNELLKKVNMLTRKCYFLENYFSYF